MKPVPRTTQPVEESSIRLAYQDFLLSRQAMRLSRYTLIFYRQTAGRFVAWAEKKGLTAPEAITAAHIREWLAESPLQTSTLRAWAEGIRTCVRFWLAEGYIPQEIKVWMPRPESHRLPCLTLEEVQRGIAACRTPREKALFLFLVDSGLRRSEALSLTWEDVQFADGTVLVRRGKGGKARTVVIGAQTRRSLLRYRKGLPQPLRPASPVFCTIRGTRLTDQGLRHMMNRIGERAGVHITPHALRRTFATLSLRGGVDVLCLQRLMGHSDLAMTSRYIQMLDVDLVSAHEAHGLDSWL